MNDLKIASAVKAVALASASLLVVFAAGCGTGLSTAVAPPFAMPAGSVSGVFMGGQQPVNHVALQLYAVGTTGYGSAATPLLAANSTFTSATGNFTFPAFTCPTPTSLIYLVGVGGQPIAASGNMPAVTNNNLALMAGLGQCQNVLNQFINVNELTTVGTIWALSPFMSGVANIGSSSSNAVGIANAFASINKVVNTANGLVSGPALPTGATLPIAEINTLADILEQCVNLGGGTASDTSTGCGKLFSYTTVGGVAPSDTITAAMNIAQNPAQNVAQLNSLRSASPVFTPTLSINTPPTDWTIAITFVGGGLDCAAGRGYGPGGQRLGCESGQLECVEVRSAGQCVVACCGIHGGRDQCAEGLGDRSEWAGLGGEHGQLDDYGACVVRHLGHGVYGQWIERAELDRDRCDGERVCCQPAWEQHQCVHADGDAGRGIALYG